MRTARSTEASLLVLVALAACAPVNEPAVPPTPVPSASTTAPAALPQEAPPLGRLPSDTRPTRYSLSLRVDPQQPRFEGAVDVAVELSRARGVIWMHGRDLAVKHATVQPEGGAAVEATWESASPSGVAALRPASPVGPGKVTIHLDYDAPWGATEQGLYVVERGKDRYAFTELEALYARRMFPCFDEPAFKTPFDVAVTVPRGLGAVANTRETSRAPIADGADRVTFAPTEPIPTYLVALAVGPLDIVAAPDIPPNAVRRRPLPLRGVATRGRGKEMEFALARTPAIVSALEAYFGSEYPYDKLDMIAVPDKGGAMENPGAITFGESLLLFDAKVAPVDQIFNFHTVAGHEIAHQWFGDLVTMRWWDDIWLNESFATWMEPRIVKAVAPKLRPELRAIDSAHYAMSRDSLVSARKIRQEIAGDQDIESAFDAITYEKGSAVLAMFERWMGEEAFQKGVRAHLAAHRFGSATADELLASLSAAAGRDVAGPLRTFLDQPGLPFVEASLSCEGKPRLLLKQSRFLPLGSSGSRDDRTWQIPICARYPDGSRVRESCTLLTEREGALSLDSTSCPTWVLPNADAAGYYRWTLAAADTQRLAKVGSAQLTERERLTFAKSLTAGLALGKGSARDAIEALAPLAKDPSYAVSAAPMGLLYDVLRWLEGDPTEPRARAFAGSLYAPAYRELGWEAKKGVTEDPSRVRHRQEVLSFLAFRARDREVRREAALRGKAYLGFGKDHVLHPEAVSPNLVGIALAVAAEEAGDDGAASRPEPRAGKAGAGAPLFDAIVAVLAKEDRESQRFRLLRALGSFVAPEVAARARELELDPRVHANEVTAILTEQLVHPATRDAAWAWYRENLDKLLARLPPTWAAYVMFPGLDFCDRAHRDEVEKLFAPRVASLEGGARAFANMLEEMSLCTARRAAHEADARAYFAKKR